MRKKRNVLKKKRTKRKLKLHLVFSCERLILFFFASFFLGLFDTMRLLTHNLLMCNKRGCTSDHFPMRIKPTKIVVEESEFNPEEVRAMYPKLDWAALVSGAKDVCFLLCFTHVSIDIHLIIFFSTSVWPDDS